MEIDKNSVKTVEESDEQPAMDKANDRVEAEMAELKKKAREDVAEGLQNDSKG